MTTTGCLRALSDMCVSLSLSLPLNRWREETVGHGEFSHEKKKKTNNRQKREEILSVSDISHVCFESSVGAVSGKNSLKNPD